MEKKYFLQRADELKQIFGKLKFFHLRQDEKPSIFDNMKVYFEFQSTLSHLRNLMQPDKVIQNVEHIRKLINSGLDTAYENTFILNSVVIAKESDLPENLKKLKRAFEKNPIREEDNNENTL